MRNFSLLLSLSFLAVTAQSCSTKLTAIPHPMDGQSITGGSVVSRQDSIVSVRPDIYSSSTESSLWIAVKNQCNDGFQFSSSDIDVKLDDKPLEVKGFREQIDQVEDEEIAQIVAAAMTGAAGVMAAHQPSYVSGSGYVSSGYGSGSWVTYSGTVYNPAAASLAANTAIMNMNSQMHSASGVAQTRRGFVELTALRDTYVETGSDCGGRVTIGQINISSNKDNILNVAIKTGNEKHRFRFGIEKYLKNKEVKHADQDAPEISDQLSER